MAWAALHIAIAGLGVWAFLSMDLSSSSILEGAVLPLAFWVALVYVLVVAAAFIGRALGVGRSNTEGGSVGLSDLAAPAATDGSGGGDSGDS
jgi:hypothetical protein